MNQVKAPALFRRPPVRDRRHVLSSALQRARPTESARVTSFTTPTGSAEHYILVAAPQTRRFDVALEALWTHYECALHDQGIAPHTLAFARVYLGDITNQAAVLRDSSLFRRLSQGAFGAVEQRPLACGGPCLLAYHVESRERVSRGLEDDRWRNATALRGRHYTMLWAGDLVSGGPRCSYQQTREIFDEYVDLLHSRDMSLRDHSLRTWIYVHDIDHHYEGMVRARRELFSRHGLTEQTRYLASTGIEGRSKPFNSLVAMDAMAIDGIEPEQIVRIEAPDYLCPTHRYGVTFERGTRIRFGDRSHYHISGTASIDQNGDVLHHGDAARQAQRTMTNVAQLLASQDASPADLAYAIVYLRNPLDLTGVQPIVEDALPPDTPVLFVEGAVCRPQWLVEVEGVAVRADAAPYPTFL